MSQAAETDHALLLARAAEGDASAFATLAHDFVARIEAGGSVRDDIEALLRRLRELGRRAKLRDVEAVQERLDDVEQALCRQVEAGQAAAIESLEPFLRLHLEIGDDAGTNAAAKRFEELLVSRIEDGDDAAASALETLMRFYAGRDDKAALGRCFAEAQRALLARVEAGDRSALAEIEALLRLRRELGRRSELRDVEAVRQGLDAVEQALCRQVEAGQAAAIELLQRFLRLHLEIGDSASLVVAFDRVGQMLLPRIEAGERPALAAIDWLLRLRAELRDEAGLEQSFAAVQHALLAQVARDREARRALGRLLRLRAERGEHDACVLLFDAAQARYLERTGAGERRAWEALDELLRLRAECGEPRGRAEAWAAVQAQIVGRAEQGDREAYGALAGLLRLQLALGERAALESLLVAGEAVLLRRAAVGDTAAYAGLEGLLALRAEHVARLTAGPAATVARLLGGRVLDGDQVAAASLERVLGPRAGRGAGQPGESDVLELLLAQVRFGDRAAYDVLHYALERRANSAGGRGFTALYERLVEAVLAVAQLGPPSTLDTLETLHRLANRHSKPIPKGDTSDTGPAGGALPANPQSKRTKQAEALAQEEVKALAERIEALLLTRIRLGNHAALATLRALYELEVLRAARRNGVVRGSYEVADAVAQAVWAAVWEDVRRFDPERSSFLTWVQIDLVRTAAKTYRGPSQWVQDEVREGKLRQVPIPIISLGERPGEAADDDPADAPEEQISYRGYSALLHLAVSEGGPPHQVLVYFFVRTLGVPPRGIVAELSDLTLRDLLRDCEDRYGKRSLLPAEVLAADFAPLREALELPVKKVITEPRTLETIPQLHEVVVGDTHLRDYFARNPDTSVTSWWHSARRRVDKALQRRLQAAQPGDPLLEVQGLLATLRPIARDEET